MLGLQSEIAGMKFEHPCNKHPTGPKKPNIDVMLSLADGSVVAIESKFTEPFGSGKRSLAEKYFKDQLWLKQRLPACQRLADAMRESWFHLDTPQLLKHMLGLAHEYPDGKCTLLYLWFDPQTEEAADHANEVARLEREIAGDRIQFVAKTYQQAFALAPASAVRQHRDYFRYMLDRYGLKTGR